MICFAFSKLLIIERCQNHHILQLAEQFENYIFIYV